MADDERPRKSWREIDRGRDTSSHGGRGREDKRPERLGRSAAYRNYKTQLNKLFDGGIELPDAMKQKLDGVAGGQAQKKNAAADAIVQAKTASALTSKLADYQGEFGFPDQEQVLEKLLEADDTATLVAAINGLGAIQQESGLKRQKAIQGRLRTVRVTADDEDVEEAIDRLLAQM